MSEDLKGQLQTSLGTTYTIERELGGGGMSRTFVAHETSLNRRVVVKVLTPDLAAGVSVDRFKREIQLSAALQHPHIVPVLAAGDSSGLPYYTMPFVDGESLRMRLTRGPLSITETIGILRDVARALAFAHAHGVVHRDIKPDNVLISGGSATVADFGIAKAISAARTNPSDATLTQLGTALGTPAYMAPEQAAGDPSTDHRADLYAFGVLAYELLAGRAPFHGLTPQRLLAAHMGEKPKPIGSLRPDTPPALADLVMRCLEKDANARPQSATDIARFLDTVTSSTGQTAAPAVLLGGRVSLTKALVLYAAAFVVVVVLAKAAIVGIGLPDWVFPTAIGVMALGLPAILFTAYVQRATHRALVATPTLTPGGTPVGQGTMATMAIAASPHVSWRRTAIGGFGAVGALILLTAAWMVMRAMGVGPAASLMSAGKLGERDKIIIADFKSPPTDSVLGPTVTDAFRTDLAQSRNLSIMPANAVREVLRRMQRPTTTTVDFGLAREVATREGIKAVVDGEVVSLGGSYVLSARLVSAQSGEELGSFRETASEAKDIIPAIGRLSKDLRSKVGESLKTIQAARTLDKVTTPSLEALQKYVQGARALETDNDWNRGRTLLEEAIAIDTGFAMAYRKLAVEHANRGSPASIYKALVKKAYDHRDRLSDAERYITIGSYYTFGPEVDRTKAISAYESLLDLDPDNVTALNNLSEHLRNQKNFVRAEELGMHAIAVQPTAAVFYENTFGAQVSLGKLDAAAKTLDIARQNIPRNFAVARMRANLALNRGEFDSAARIIDSVRVARQGDVAARGNTEFFLGAIAGARGHIAESLRHLAASHAAEREFGSRTADIDAVTDSAVYLAFHLNRPDEGARILDRALAAHPLDSVAIEDRPLTALIEAYTLAKRPDRAKALLAQLDRRISQSPLGSDDQDRVVAGGQIALAEGRYADAIRDLRAATATGCVICRWPEIGRAYDAAGQPDSAIAAFERYVNGYAPGRIIGDVNGLASSMLRTAELYDAKGNADKAASYYARFVDLWKTADPELQPTVKKARDRLQQLQRKTG